MVSTRSKTNSPSTRSLDSSKNSLPTTPVVTRVPSQVLAENESSPSEQSLTRETQDASEETKMNDPNFEFNIESLTAEILKRVSRQLNSTSRFDDSQIGKNVYLSRHESTNIPVTTENSIPDGRDRESVLRKPWSSTEDSPNRMVFGETGRPLINSTQKNKELEIMNKHTKNMDVKIFKPDNELPDKGFRKWRRTFENGFTTAPIEFTEGAKIQALKKFTEGSTNDWIYENEERLKTVKELLDGLQKHFTTGISAKSTLEFINKCKKEKGETLLDFKDRVLSVAKCVPGEFSGIYKETALSHILTHISEITGHDGIRGCVPTDSSDLENALEKALKYMYQVLGNDGTELGAKPKAKPSNNDKTKKRKEEAHAVVTKPTHQKRKSRDETDSNNQNKWPRRYRDFSKFFCRICNKNGHSTGYHIKAGLEPKVVILNNNKSVNKSVNFKEGEASAAVKEDPKEEEDDEPTEDEGPVYEAYLVEIEKLHIPAEAHSATATKCDPEWGLDSCASAHMTYDMELLSDIREDEPMIVKIADGKEYLSSTVGTAILRKGNSYLQLQNVYYVPQFRRHLISAGQLTKSGLEVHLRPNEGLVYNGKEVIAKFRKQSGIYVQHFSRN